MKSNKKQVLAIGIEVGNFHLIRDWIDAGLLPTLSALAKRGAFLPMSTVTEISSGSIWPTFYTATNPLKNAQFFTHMQLQRGSYKINKKYADDVPVEPFWAPLARGGRRVFSFDVAQTCPIENFNGVNLCAWGSEYPAWPRSSWPKPLMRELVSKYGSHPLVNQYRLSISPDSEEEYEAFYRKLTSGIERKGNICLEMLERESWDLSLIVFPEVHWAMHLLWQTYDKEHPAYDPSIKLPFDNIFLDLYKRLDAWIGQFIKKSAGASVIVFSGSGLGANYSGWHLLPEVLEKIGMSSANENESARKLARFLPMQAWGAYKIRNVEDSLSLSVIEFFKKVLPAAVWDKATRRLLYAGNRWADSKAFCLPNDYSGAIRINLQDREPSGRVSPGDEYRNICREIAAELNALINPDTGRPAVSDVIQLHELYPNEELGDFPDLIVVWASDAPITSLTSPHVGTIRGDFPERRSGAHRNDCFLISNEPMKNNSSDSDGPTIMDIAPTIFELLSVDSPTYFDGKSLLG